MNVETKDILWWAEGPKCPVGRNPEDAYVRMLASMYRGAIAEVARLTRERDEARLEIDRFNAEREATLKHHAGVWCLGCGSLDMMRHHDGCVYLKLTAMTKDRDDLKHHLAMYEADGPTTVLRRERDEARQECQEQARLNGMGSEREAKLRAERDDMRLDRDAQVEALSESLESLEEANARAGAKDEALKAALHKDQSCPCYLCVLIRAALSSDGSRYAEYVGALENAVKCIDTLHRECGASMDSRLVAALVIVEKARASIADRTE